MQYQLRSCLSLAALTSLLCGASVAEAYGQPWRGGSWRGNHHNGNGGYRPFTYHHHMVNQESETTSSSLAVPSESSIPDTVPSTSLAPRVAPSQTISNFDISFSSTLSSSSSSIFPSATCACPLVPAYMTVTVTAQSCEQSSSSSSSSSSLEGSLIPDSIGLTTASISISSVASTDSIPLPSTSFSASSVGSSTSIVLPSASSKTPVCTPIPKGPNPQDASTPNFTFEQLYKLQTTFLDNFMYPANAIQAKMINSTLFADNIKGRVDVTRTFDGPELNTEYLFGLFATLSLNPQAVSLLGYPTNYTITHFAANQNIAAASTIITFNFASLGVTVPVEIDTWNLFDADGKILEYDATFRWFQYLYDYLFEAVAPKINATSVDQVTAYFTRALAQGICTTHQTYCNGTNAQYSSFADCASFITTKIRFGKAYELGMNTVLCRMVHENMIPFRPDVHCPHIGPSGGGMCVDDYTYPRKVLEPYFTNAPFVPYGFQDGDESVAAQ